MRQLASLQAKGLADDKRFRNLQQRPVQVLRSKTGLVQGIALRPEGVLVTFTVADDIQLGEQTDAAIKTMTLLGNKALVVTPAEAEGLVLQNDSWVAGGLRGAGADYSL